MAQVTEPLRTGDTWRVRLGSLIEGERQIISMHQSTVELCAPTVHMTDVYRWHEVEFIELLRRHQ